MKKTTFQSFNFLSIMVVVARCARNKGNLATIVLTFVLGDTTCLYFLAFNSHDSALQHPW